MVQTDKASSQGLTILHYAIATVFFLCLNLLLFFSADAFAGHYFHPKLLTLTHIAVLGWGIMIIMGAIYQFLPVIVETRMHSEKLAIFAIICLSAGTILLSYSFWFFKIGIEIQIASSLILTAFIAFAINVNATLRKAKKWGIAADFIQCASMWLIVTAVIGILMALNFRYPFLPESHLVYLNIHAHTGLVGWFLLLIIGVASKLLPMFLLSHAISEKPLKLAFWFINAGLISFIIDHLLFQSKVPYLHFALLLTGMILFGRFCAGLVKNRIRRNMDWPMKQSIAAIILLIFPIALGAINLAEFPALQQFSLKISIAYGVSIIMGFITALIMGQTFKTLPFIVWMYGYKNKDIHTTVLPKDLYSEKLVALMQYFYFPGICFFVASILCEQKYFMYLSFMLMLAAVALYCFNVAKIIYPLVRISHLRISNRGIQYAKRNQHIKLQDGKSTSNALKQI